MKKKAEGKKAIKSKLHPRNKHQQRYDFKELIATLPALAPFVALNKYGDESIDFFNPAAVKMLNKALLLHYYGIEYWDIPPNYLCPPIPGRADYIHHIADLLGSSNGGQIPTGKTINCLDIGVGANCVYPIIGHHEYGWSFRGTDIDRTAIQAANKIIENNGTLNQVIKFKYQINPTDIFYGILDKKEYFDLTICNPPFHTSALEAQSSAIRKVKNLTGKKKEIVTPSFGGQPKELWCPGGEKQFIKRMIQESKKFAPNCLWFSTLVSKESNLIGVKRALKKAVATEVKIIEMGQGQKKSRIVAWSFLKEKRRDQWVAKRWKMEEIK